jgi:integrase
MADKIRLTKDLIGRWIKAGNAIEVRDAQAPGLIFRVRASGVHGYSIKRQVYKHEKRLTLDADWSLDEARDIAQEVDLRIRERRDPWVMEPADWGRWYNRKLRAKRGEPEPKEEPKVKVVFGPTMNWETGTKEWLEELKRTKREATVDGYRKALNVQEVKPLHNKIVGNITRQDVAEAVDRIAKRGKERQAELTLSGLKSMWEFLGSDAVSRRSGVQKGLIADMKPPERTLVEEEDYDDDDNSGATADGFDVARIVRAFRDDSSKLHERDRLAGLLTVYTVQRRRTVACARIGDFQTLGDVIMWAIPPIHRKSASIKARIRRRRADGTRVGTHLIPLTGDAVRVFRRAKELAKDSDFLFPSMRERRAGQESKHVDPSTVTHVFSKVAGNTFTPHDMRRALGTSYGAFANLRIADIKPILDHSEGIAHGDVTAEHYAFLSHTSEKLKLLEGYMAWIESFVNRKE